MFLIIYQDVVEYQPKKTLRDDEREKDLVRLFIQLSILFSSFYIKVDVQPWLGNYCSNFGQNLNHQTSYIYKSGGGRGDTSKAG